jgi:hypothetical protein
MRSFCFVGKRAQASENAFSGEQAGEKDLSLSRKNRTKGLVSMGEFYEEEFFKDLLGVERKKTERSERPFLVMLINIDHLGPQEREEVTGKIVRSLFSTSRETDVKGWYKSSSVIGIIFTDPNPDNDITCFQDMIFDKVCGDIKSVIGMDQYNKLEVGLDVFPKGFFQINSRAGSVGVAGV